MPKLEKHSKNPRGRPRKEETRKAVLDAAYEILQEQGYGAATFEAIAKRSKVSRPTLYRRWDSRKELMLDLLKERVSHISALSTGNPELDMSALIKQIFDNINSSLAPVLKALAIEALLDPVFAARIHETFEPWRQDQFHRILQQEDLTFKPINPAIAWDIVMGAIWQRLIFRHSELDNELADELSALLVKQSIT